MSNSRLFYAFLYKRIARNAACQFFTQICREINVPVDYYTPRENQQASRASRHVFRARARNSTSTFRGLTFRLLRCNEHSHDLSLNGFHA